MKSCPDCGRTFEDTLTFCLMDGAILSPPFDPEETVQIQAARETAGPTAAMTPVGGYLSPRESAAIAFRPRFWPRLIVFIILTPIICLAAGLAISLIVFTILELPPRIGEKVMYLGMLATFVGLVVQIARWWRREHRKWV